MPAPNVCPSQDEVAGGIKIETIPNTRQSDKSLMRKSVKPCAFDCGTCHSYPSEESQF